MIKKSRQREAILQCLVNRYDHPTAETVYLSIKDDFPNISLGTVYRNLSLLLDLGEIQKITVNECLTGSMEILLPIIISLAGDVVV